MSDPRVYILCRFADESRLYSSWLERLPYSHVIVKEPLQDWTPPRDAGIVITHQHYRWEEVQVLRRVYEQKRIPTLLLADGILDYCNTWEHPDLPDGSMFQPLIANKLACIGNAQARMVSSWGNAGKCEVVGLPRLDGCGNLKQQAAGSEFRILVSTATTPAFTDQQREEVLRSLNALKEFAESNSQIGNRKLTFTWRLTDQLENDLGLPAAVQEPIPFWESLANCDAVITTPSTLYLESALSGRPTAILDFLNRPQFVPASWTISAPEHIAKVIEQLAEPPASKIQHQKFVLRDQLQAENPATDRMIELVCKMIDFGLMSMEKRRPLSLPPTILPAVSAQFESIELDQIYPNNEIFKRQELVRLQLELNQAIERMGKLPDELEEKNNQIAQLQLHLDESRRRVANLRSRIFKLRKILGIGQEKLDDESLEL